MEPLAILLILAVVVLVGIAIYYANRNMFEGIDYRGSYPRTPQSNLRRPIHTILLHQTTPEVQKEIREKTRLAVVRDVPIPSSFDSRQQWPGLITNPLDQGSCGSCWAFSSATAVSDRLRIANPGNSDLRQTITYTPYDIGVSYQSMNNLSPYAVVNCDICTANSATRPMTTQFLINSGECNNACRGGIIANVYQYMKDYGVITLQCSPPSCNPATTRCPCAQTTSCTVYKPSDIYAVVGPNDDQPTRIQKIQQEILTNGPVTVGYTVYNSFFTFFENTPTGIYSSAAQPAGDTIDGGHAVDIVGWGTDATVGLYWIVRNSWGTSWGDQGYFKYQATLDDMTSECYAASA